MIRTLAAPPTRASNLSGNKDKDVFDGRSGGAKGSPAVPPRNSAASPLILVTGASGYVGGRLVPALEARLDELERQDATRGVVR